MTDQQAQVPPPGWYPDTADQTLVRWWNGSAWTDDRRPVSNQSSPPASFTSRMYSGAADARSGTNSAATIGFIGGIVCFLLNPFMLIGIAGIIWSAIGLRRASSYERRGLFPVGRRMAAWGLGLSVLGTVAFVFIRLPSGLFFI